MTPAEAKAEIITALQQNSINVLIETLAGVRIENEQLKAQVAALSAKPAEVPE